MTRWRGFCRLPLMARALALVLALAPCLANPLGAASDLCDGAAQDAARATGVPVALLLTLTRVETGRGGPESLPEPWPWTLNTGGRGSFHDSPLAALQTARRAIAAGQRNIDIGCFQINYRWHGDRFPSLEAMLDPGHNALHAARFLRDLHAEFGDWTAAAAAFHSRNPEHAAAYLSRFEAIGAVLSRERAADGGVVRRSFGPGPLVMATRPALTAGLVGALNGAARPPLSTTARPLWETR
ncbi:lytic transglycosylase domain-containing protein [uncultured Roseicyclus sp.]|jgi:hypothetical protein|uniref:lytic transglycosylase domain-containing protein n=1 Tax=uncultured Roseicyclus sp. TaxID=543072 RepID=UPI002601C71A|nr:lytic transglycosylase domain-containing protein [uncultured Roseicyclus sp.]